jgi:uncharacterized membrane protein YdbT with pleckstrin-like domain
MFENGNENIEKRADKKILYHANPAMIRSKPFHFALLVALLVAALILPWFVIQSLAIAIGVFVMVLLSFAGWLYNIKSTDVLITNTYIRVTNGIFDKEVTQIFLQDITKFRCQQTFWQRILNVGKIEVSSSASSETEIEVDHLPRPREILVNINSNR